MRGVEEAERSVGGDPITSRPPLIVSGSPLSWADVQPVLAEAAGAAAIEEVVLDRMLGREFERRGWTVTDAEIEQERLNLEQSIARPGLDRAEVERLIADIRRNRSLGPARFASLLRRNAMLRRLVRDQVRVAPEEVSRLHEVRYGPRDRVRIIVTATHQEAGSTLAELEAAAEPNAPSLSLRFAELAAARSIDESGARGGMVEPISSNDPAYPESVLATLRRMEPGSLSRIVALDQGYAIILLEERIPPTGTTLDEVRESLRAELHTRKERLAMDERAREMLASAGVTVIDPHLRWSWEARRPPDR